MSRGVLGLFLLSVAACSSKADAPTADAPPTTPSDGTTTSTLPTSTPSTTDSAPLTDTWPWPTRFPTADTAGSGQRSACDPGDLSPLPPPPVVPGEALSGCLAGLSRTELVKPLTLASADVSPLGPGSGACLYDQLSFQVSSEPTATLPDAVSLVSWDLTTGTRRGATPLVLDGLADQLLDATAMMTPADLQVRTGDEGSFVVGDLGDLPRTNFYQGVHFEAQDRGEEYDVAYRVWHKPPGGLEPVKARFQATFPDIAVSDEVTDQTWVYDAPDIRAVAFIDSDAETGVLLTCGPAQCADIDTAVIVAKFLRASLSKIRFIEAAEAPSPTPAAEGGQP